MKTFIKKPRYWIPLGFAAFLTVAIALVTNYVSRHYPSLTYLDDLFNQRGNGSYGIIFSGLAVTLCALWSIRQNQFHLRLSYLFIILSFMPLVCGLVLWRIGLLVSRSVYQTLMANTPSYGEIVKIEQYALESAAGAFDSVWLAIWFFAISMAVSFHHWAYSTHGSSNKDFMQAQRPRPAYFKAWVAYYFTHVSIALLIAMNAVWILEINKKHSNGLSLGDYSLPMQYVVGLLINGVLSYPIYRWSCKSMVIRSHAVNRGGTSESTQ